MYIYIIRQGLKYYFNLIQALNHSFIIPKNISILIASCNTIIKFLNFNNRN